MSRDTRHCDLETRFANGKNGALCCAGLKLNRAINGVPQQVALDMLNRVNRVTNVLGSFSNTVVGGTALISTNFAPFGKKTIF